MQVGAGPVRFEFGTLGGAFFSRVGVGRRAAASTYSCLALCAIDRVHGLLIHVFFLLVNENTDDVNTFHAD
jgi:hypothetical protein